MIINICISVGQISFDIPTWHKCFIGKTGFVIYVVAPGLTDEQVRGFAFEEVFESEPAFNLRMERMKEYFKKK